MDWTKWCRLCGKEHGNQIDIFIKNENNCSNISETIQKYFLITINSYDEIPTRICNSCNEFLIDLLSFSDKTNKVQQMFLELEYLMKLNSPLNLTELRIKYSIEDFNCTKSNWNNIASSSKPGNEELFTDSIRRRKISKIINKKSLDLNTNCSNYESKLCEDNLDETDEIEENIQVIKVEVGTNIEEIVSVRHELKKEDYTLEQSNNYNNNSEDGVHFDSNMESEYPYLSSPNQNSCTIKTKRVQIKKLRSKKIACMIQQDNNPKRVKKKYRDEEKRIQCEMCPMKFVRENNLSAHLKKAHQIVKELPPCEFCGKICKTKQKLKFHRELHLPHEEREKLLYKCPHCSQKFTQKGAMRSHIRGTHSHERPFICEACGKAFTSQSNLWAHRKKTHEENLMPCEICQKVCKNSSSLRKHMSTHKDPSIPCSICGILLKTKKTLKNHMLVHSDIKAFQCNYCGKEFKRDITLQLHMIIHSGLKPYVCRFCEQTYANPSNCKKHEKHSHPIEYQSAEGANGPSQPQRVLKKLPNIKQLKAMLEDMKAAKENN